MRKLLLFTFVISLLGTVSCSKDEEHTEVSQEEKEYLVKQTLIEFNKSAVKTGKYREFINSVYQKSSLDQLTSTELEILLQDFLGDQTQQFLSVYYKLEALNLSSEEFLSIADQFEYLRINSTQESGKIGGCCAIGSNSGDSLLGDLIRYTCSCDADADTA